MDKLASQLIKENKLTKNVILDLGNCGLNELPQELFECVWLEDLRLSANYYDFAKEIRVQSNNKQGENKISSIAPEISKLSKLKHLRAGGNVYQQWNLQETKTLENLLQLQTLELKFSNISDISFLDKLSNLQFLDLSGNNISDFNSLVKLTELKFLGINSNNISDIGFLENSNSLQSLNLSSNAISNVESLKKLTKLHSLILNSNKISDITNLSELTMLKSLDLGSNEISDIANLSELTMLKSLDLGSNQISDATVLSKLTVLTSLDLSGNPNLTDISFLEHLTGLESLYLSRANVSDFNSLTPLIRLETLFLASNNISDISFLNTITNLNFLFLSYNSISNISALKNLKNLETLLLSRNSIRDISPLENLTNLRAVDLGQNDIMEVSLDFFEKITLEPVKDESFGLEKGKINFYGNELHIPDEVFNQGRNAIIEYLSGELKSLNECKLIFVGDGGVGKTSLMQRLVFNNFNDDEKTTHGINKISWDEIQSEEGDKIKVNLWDFGGQHIQHSLHQFFFTQRVMYVLVLNPRNDEKAVYWLEQIDKLGKGSEILIVYNWKDEKDKEANYLNNFHEFRKKYPKLPDPFIVSCKTNSGIHEFKNKLQECILKNGDLKTKYRKEWFNIKKYLEEQVDVRTNYIEYAQYEQWCSYENYNDNGRKKELLRILNSIGSIVYFDKPVLNKLQVLNPEWITTGAYAILTAEKTNENKGDLSWDDLKEIFREEKSVFSNQEIKIKYEEEHFLFIIELMLEYRLLQKNPLRNYSYLIPSAFGESPINPAYQEVKINRTYYRIQFNSPFEMLIIHRFIAKNIVNITGKDYWYSGIYMKHATSDTYALVETNVYSYRIDCWIKGGNIRGFWETIRNDFRKIFNIYHNFPYSEEVLYQKDGKQVFLPYGSIHCFSQSVAAIEERLLRCFCTFSKWQAVRAMGSIR